MSEQTTNFESGAVRSADRNHLDFTSLPLVGLIGVARTAAEGGTKYGRFNYMKGMPVHDLLNHVFGHLVLYVLGDRSEPHLEHAAWGILAAIQSQTLDPQISAPHMIGPGASLSPAVLAHLDEQAPILKAKREAGEFAGVGNWKLADLPEIKTLLAQRECLQRSTKVPWTTLTTARTESHAPIEQSEHILGAAWSEYTKDRDVAPEGHRVTWNG